MYIFYTCISVMEGQIKLHGTGHQVAHLDNLGPSSSLTGCLVVYQTLFESPGCVTAWVPSYIAGQISNTWLHSNQFSNIQIHCITWRPVAYIRTIIQYHPVCKSTSNCISGPFNIIGLHNLVSSSTSSLIMVPLTPLFRCA